MSASATHSMSVRNTHTLEPDYLGIESCLCHLLVVCPWVDYLTFLRFHFLVYKMEINTVSTPHRGVNELFVVLLIMCGI